MGPCFAALKILRIGRYGDRDGLQRKRIIRRLFLLLSAFDGVLCGGCEPCRSNREMACRGQTEQGSMGESGWESRLHHIRGGRLPNDFGNKSGKNAPAQESVSDTKINRLCWFAKLSAEKRTRFGGAGDLLRHFPMTGWEPCPTILYYPPILPVAGAKLLRTAMIEPRPNSECRMNAIVLRWNRSAACLGGCLFGFFFSFRQNLDYRTMVRIQIFSRNSQHVFRLNFSYFPDVYGIVVVAQTVERVQSDFFGTVP